MSIVPAHRWRSLHFVPGASDRMLEKASTLGADALILDLEDAVPPEGKEAARGRVAEWLGATSARSGSRAARLVRINALDTGLARGDLAATFPSGPDGYVVPKVTGHADLAQLDAWLGELEDAAGRERGTTPLVAIATETPRAVFALEAIADGPRVAGLTWGSEDLSAAIGATRTRREDGSHLPVFEAVRHWTLLAAHAAAVAAIDGVFTAFRDGPGLERECAEAAASGFTGKLTIHPAQIEPVNHAFTPSPAAIAEARALLDAYERHRETGRGAFAFDGSMIDAPHLARARRLLERARPADGS